MKLCWCGVLLAMVVFGACASQEPTTMGGTTGALSSSLQYTCTGKKALQCNDDNPCTRDCLSKQGCVHLVLTGSTPACDDHDACTTDDHCSIGTCKGTPLSCDDHNACTTDACAGGICQHADVPEATPCDDGDLCTHDDSCGTVGDCQGIPTSCQTDDNTCTAEQCNHANGACVSVNVVDGANCDDGNACTVSDTCDAGQCKPGAPYVCTPSGQCDAPICLSGSLGAHCEVFSPSTDPCDDGIACTVDDRCTTPWDCEGTGNSALCDDGVECTQDFCFSDGCDNPILLFYCEDADPCTADSCDPNSGCVHEPICIGGD